MKIEKFQIANLVKEYILAIEQNLDNFPKKELELKKNIKETSYEILLKIYEANTTQNTEKRKERQEEIMARIKYLDFLITLCYDKKIINGKRYLKLGEKEERILKYLSQWKKVTI